MTKMKRRKNTKARQGIPLKFAKKKKGMVLGFITFEDEEQMKSSSKKSNSNVASGVKSDKENAGVDGSSLDGETNDDDSGVDGYVCTASFDDAQVTAEFKRLTQTFVIGATSLCPTLPLSALVVQRCSLATLVLVVSHLGFTPGAALLAVIGIEMNASALSDVHRNAEINRMRLLKRSAQIKGVVKTRTVAKLGVEKEQLP
ncbi:hypothetical protein RJT34_29889 [Clitoria ternatea]|uniref:Uncharacterized protein n=1 Tax=Clitoria ternatea TaxID=43366 RepID=A0AAN9ERE4_CLITE